MVDISQVKALTFDVFGTVVDWRGTLTREGQAFGAQRGRLCRRLSRRLWSRDGSRASRRATLDQHRRPAPHDPRRTARAL